MTTTESWEIINEKEETEYHSLVYLQGDDADDLLFALDKALTFLQTKKSSRYTRLAAMQRVLRATQKTFWETRKHG